MKRASAWLLPWTMPLLLAGVWGCSSSSDDASQPPSEEAGSDAALADQQSESSSPQDASPEAQASDAGADSADSSQTDGSQADSTAEEASIEASTEAGPDAAPPTEPWAKAFGGTARDLGLLTALDSQGNLYVAGEFEGTASFGSHSITSNGGTDAFLVKLSPAGEALWAKAIGGEGEESPLALVVNSEDNPILAGWFWGDVDFGQGTFSSQDDFSSFILRADPDGNFVTSKPLNLALIYDMAIDAQDHLAVVGSYSYDTNLGTGDITNLGHDDAFAAMFEYSLGILWSHNYSSADNEGASAVAYDPQGNIVVVGKFQNTLNVGASNPLQSADGYDAFLLKLNSDGNTIFSQNYGGTGGQSVSSLRIASNGDILVTGPAEGGASFPGGGSITCSSCVYVARLNAQAQHQWSRKLENPQTSRAIFDAQNNIYVSGAFTGALDVGGSAPLNHAGGAFDFDAYLVKYNAQGEHQWSYQGGTTASAGGMVMSPTGHLIVTGGFKEQIQLGPNPLRSVGGYDVFVLGLLP